jgi:hypothetical protein
VDGVLRIARRDGGELLIDAARLAGAFFRSDPSSRGPRSFDAFAGRTAVDRIERSDLNVLNRTVTARSSPELWESLFDRPLAALTGLDPELDLVTATEEVWQVGEAERRIEAAMLAVLGPRRGLAVSTKMLHLKRPRLFPILDSLVAQMLGFPAPYGTSVEARAVHGVRLIGHLREQGRRNLDVLKTVQAELAAEEIERTLVRILDGVLWASHPAASPGLRRVFEIGACS